MIVCADGYIIEVTGPYGARTSDSDIVKLILDNHDGPMEEAPMRWFLHPNDVFVLDRGFRDCLPDLEGCGCNAYMPPSVGRNERQLSTIAANKSRLITMVRWVVETINGTIKRDFKIFRHKYFNIALGNAMTDYRIAAALTNATHLTYEDSRFTEEFIEMIERNRDRPNLLADYVDEHHWDRQRIAFALMDATNPNLSDFPRMDYDQLIVFAIGTYHVKLARSYCCEHIRGTGVFSIEVFRHPERININNEESTLIRCRIHSRHVGTRTYYCYVLYNTNRISEYCCSCIHGRRTLGSCAHIISIIYYLAWARYQDDLMQPAVFLDHILIDIENN
ncbi:uncharacterized protein LOC124644764 [Helicoverpa zea]|uniref:uncharacterized protein LOC124644764 n=1 Tax=Helicoverpa zea TaxID=7113 RepID=UPI001F579080|nr:uncharacterized protein LOC124644764 [Helicoverpa zea]